MCAYCGCQAVAAVAELTREHDFVVDLVGRMRVARLGGDVSALAELARKVAAVLGPHTVVEEEGLFPALTEAFPDHVATLRAEHRRIEAVLGEAADGTPGDPSWPDRMIEAGELLREHILKEQDGVFPAALAELSPEQWDAVDAVRARAGSELPTVSL